MARAALAVNARVTPRGSVWSSLLRQEKKESALTRRSSNRILYQLSECYGSDCLRAQTLGAIGWAGVFRFHERSCSDKNGDTERYV
jgi:hypothetical protein